jgi:hypothetical protein
VGAEPTKDAGGESGGERAILLVTAHSDEFVDCTARQSAARQRPIDRSDAEGQYPMRRRRRPLDPPNPFAKHQEKIVRHASLTAYVAFLFLSGQIVNPRPLDKCCLLLEQMQIRQHALLDRLVLGTLMPVGQNLTLGTGSEGPLIAHSGGLSSWRWRSVVRRNCSLSPFGVQPRRSVLADIRGF